MRNLKKIIQLKKNLGDKIMLNNQKGFTLIELMVVVVIIGILAAIALPNFLSMQDRAKESEVKSNVHTIQLVVEDYKTQYNGGKPTIFAAAQAGVNATPPVAQGGTGQAVVPATLKNPFTTTTALVNIAGVIVAQALVLPAPVLPFASPLATGGLVGYTMEAGPAGTGAPYIITGTGKINPNTGTAPYVAITQEGQ